MYPVYKLIRSINRQYPNNGFISPVDVNEETLSEVIDEDFRDIINECLQEIYKDVAIDEVYSFQTVPGQNQYVLPEDCDLRDIQEVVRTGGLGGYPHYSGIASIEEIEGDEEQPVAPADYYYNGWVPNHYMFNKHSRRLVWARDAEELTGDRYFNAWDYKRIGISPTPRSNYEVITIYYKKKPKEIVYFDDEVQIKDEFMPILKYRILMELAKSGSNPDIDLYNVFAVEFNNLMQEAKREKDADQPYYQHTKDNARSPDYFRRRWGGLRRW